MPDESGKGLPRVGRDPDQFQATRFCVTVFDGVPIKSGRFFASCCPSA